MNTFANPKLLGKSAKKNEHFRVENKINEKNVGIRKKELVIWQ